MFFNTLSGRFLGLTIIFVMIAEVLIFVPSVARFRENYLQNRLELAQLAALAQLATPEEGVSPDLESELLETAQVLNVVLRRDEIRELVLSSAMPEPVAATYNIVEADPFQLMRDAIAVYFHTENRVIRVIGRTTQGARSLIEVTLHEAPLRAAMVDYGLRILYLSLAISVSTAALLFLAVQRLIVRPISRVVDHMTAYRDNPEDASRIIEPENSVQELRRAETALQDLQRRLTGALKQKERLAALGGAVAKISHDLRNLLTTAQLLADRIEASADPAVKRTAPKLVNSLSRAISLCERTLAFGKAEEPPPDMRAVTLGPLVAEMIENERLSAQSALVELVADVPEGLRVRADPEQLFRILANLTRNAVQAIEASRLAGTVTVSARETAEGCEIVVADTGPGLPEKARANLFQPFRGGVRQGGSGLGLVIASELVKGHGGSLALERSGPEGTAFRILLPALVADRPRARAVGI
jgi:signal transduction histidine kinase